MRVVVQEDPFNLGVESETFAAGAEGAGAVVTFTGIVRDLQGGGMQAMEIEPVSYTHLTLPTTPYV